MCVLSKSSSKVQVLYRTAGRPPPQAKGLVSLWSRDTPTENKSEDMSEQDHILLCPQASAMRLFLMCPKQVPFMR